jgi:DNA mismatch endonuclease, patch repair protein
MVDRITKKHRSWNMSRIKSRDTKPEKAVRSALHRLGFRFRLHCKDLPGSPDIVLPKYRTIIFVHGCFWHRHDGCKFSYDPKSRVDFWMKKFQTNINRDKRVRRELDSLDWRSCVIWECETLDPVALEMHLRTILQSSSANSQPANRI